MKQRPPIWQMVREAAGHIRGAVSYAQIKEYIRDHYGEVNDKTMTCQITICSVNHPSRVHYPENKKPRLAQSQYDFLFNTGRGRVERFDPKVHGSWEIAVDDYGKVVVRQEGLTEDEESGRDEQEADVLSFPLESHLRDFIVKNLNEIQTPWGKLRLYVDKQGRDGVEYPTDVGPIDILAQDDHDDFVVFELKLARGADRAVGQILRYMGWVKKVVAHGKDVKGVIVAQKMTDKLKYAVSLVPSIALLEYRLRFDLAAVQLE